MLLKKQHKVQIFIYWGYKWYIQRLKMYQSKGLHMTLMFFYPFQFDFHFYLKLKLSSIYKFGLSVCLYPKNIKTAEPIGPKFFVGSRMTPGKVRIIKSSKICFHQNSIFEHFGNPRNFVLKI